MAELLGSAGRHGEGRGSEALELQYYIGWVVKGGISISPLFEG